MAGLLGTVAVAAVATVVLWQGSVHFESAGERLSRYYGLPVAVHGAIVVAVGSSFPEISSIVISTVLHVDFSLGVGALVNPLVIPAVSSLSTEKLESTRDLVLADPPSWPQIGSGNRVDWQADNDVSSEMVIAKSRPDEILR